MSALQSNGGDGSCMPRAHRQGGKALSGAGDPLSRRPGNLGYAYAMSLLDLGRVVAREHRLGEAEALDRQGLESLTHFVDRDDQRLTDATAQLAEVLRAEGK